MPICDLHAICAQCQKKKKNFFYQNELIGKVDGSYREKRCNNVPSLHYMYAQSSTIYYYHRNSIIFCKYIYLYEIDLTIKYVTVELLCVYKVYTTMNR